MMPYIKKEAYEYVRRTLRAERQSLIFQKQSNKKAFRSLEHEQKRIKKQIAIIDDHIRLITTGMNDAE